MTTKLPPLDIGQKFGDWTVIAQLEHAVENPRVGYSRVRCVCGTEKDIINNRLRRGDSNGCGCRRGRLLGISGTTHGKSYSPLYRLWQSIKHRLKFDLNYVQLGTKMHGPWVTDFEAFEAYILSLGPKPTLLHTLDRIESTGDYAPGNLRWDDKTLQSVNRRNNILSNLETNSKVAVGQKHDMLTVLELVVRRAQGRNWYGARVKCDCGTIKTVNQIQLLSSRTKSCGCHRRSNVMRGLGPTVLEKPVTVNGETRSMSEWARRTGVSKHVIWNRINKLGWNPADAVTVSVWDDAEKITIGGVTKTVFEWCQNGPAPYVVAYKRIHRLGWDPARAVTEPMRKYQRPKRTGSSSPPSS